MRGLSQLRETTEAHRAVRQNLMDAARKAATAIAGVVGEPITFTAEGYEVAAADGTYHLLLLPDRITQEQWSLEQCRQFARQVQDGLLEHFAAHIEAAAGSLRREIEESLGESPENPNRPGAEALAVLPATQRIVVQDGTATRQDLMPEPLQCIQCQHFLPPEEVYRLMNGAGISDCPNCHASGSLLPFLASASSP